MSELSTNKMSSKSRVVTPDDARKRLGLEAGLQFAVVAGQDAIILKAISTPSMNDFDALLRSARRQARKPGINSQT